MSAKATGGARSINTAEAQEACWDGAGAFADELRGATPRLPERSAWQRLCTALRSGEPSEANLALEDLHAVLSRRLAGEPLPAQDGYTEDHRLAPTDALGGAWKRYKASIVASSLTEASTALRELKALAGVR
jgi:hypothetical protein